MINKIVHVGLSVRNEKKALDFYCNILGFEVIEKGLVNENFSSKALKIKNLNYIKVGQKNLVIELYIMPRDFEKGKWNHIAFSVDNIDDVYTSLLDSKVRFISEPIVNETGELKICFCKDFDGNLIKLVEELGESKGKRPKIKISSVAKTRQKTVEKAKTKTRVVSPSLSQRMKGKNRTISESEMNKDYKDAK